MTAKEQFIGKFKKRFSKVFDNNLFLYKSMEDKLDELLDEFEEAIRDDQRFEDNEQAERELVDYL